MNNLFTKDCYFVNYNWKFISSGNSVYDNKEYQGSLKFGDWNQ